MNQIKQLPGILLLFSVLIFYHTAQAHENEIHYDQIHLSVSASAQVENDTMVAVVYAEEEGGHAAELADVVNKRIRRALELIKTHSEIKHQTNAYSSNPVYSNNKIKGWRVRQSLQLESQDMTLMSDVLGKLQHDLALQSMRFTVSPETRNRQDEQLIDKALENFEKRARQITTRLGRKNYKIVNITIMTSAAGGFRPQYPMRGMAMSSMESAPPVSAGEQTVSVTVDGSIELE